MKNKIIKSSLLLITSSIITKALGAIIRIILTRNISIEDLSTYMIILPIIGLITTINSLSLQTTLTKLISDKNKNSKNLIISVTLISILINLILTLIIISSAKTISINILKNKNTYYPLLLIPTLLPINSLEQILKGYFYGKEKHIPIIISSIIENTTRLILIINIITKKEITKNLILANLISEIISVITLIIQLPKKIKINKKDIIPNKSYILETLKYSIPSTITKLTSTLSLSLEPILITLFIKNTQIISQEYTIIKAYILPLLLIPTFITINISQVILPKLRKEPKNKKIIKQAIKSSLIISITTIIIITTLNQNILKILYKTTLGSKYLLILSPLFALHGIEPILITILESKNKEKFILKTNTITNSIKILSLLILSITLKNIYSLIISISLEILITNTLYIIKIKKLIKSTS